MAAIDAGQLQYRVGSIHGNPWLRLLRREVENLMKTTYNDREHTQRRAKAELRPGQQGVDAAPATVRCAGGRAS